MIKEMVEKWYKNKGKLEQWLKTTHPKTYKVIVEKLFELVINDYDYDWENFNVSKITVINDSCHDGTQIFVIPRNKCTPEIYDYLITNTYYGSCTSSDTLKGIRDDDNDYDDEECTEEDDRMYDTPTEGQVKDYMTLALHLVQKLKWMSTEAEEEEN